MDNQQQPKGRRIAMQVGTEIRFKSNGDVVIDNPELEVARETEAADAVLLYSFDEKTGEHSLRLLEPLAEHRAKRHSRGV